MNATVRTATAQGLLFGRPWVVTIPAPGIRVFILLALLLVTALGVVYCKDLNRRLFINYQNAQQEFSQLNTQYGKLLLEDSAWSTQAHIEAVASSKLGMIVPTKTNVVLINKP